MLALTLAVVAAAAACGGGGGSSGSPASQTVEEPTSGGSVTYGLEAETSGGWCLPEAQLVTSGIEVARAVYDTLVVPDEHGDSQPFLAESITANADSTQFTITLRDGITFHDGTPLDATVVKNNLDAYRGAYPNRHPLLFTFVFSNIADVAVVDPLTVVVTTKSSWPAFPSMLYGSGRVGIMAQSQLDDPSTCDRALVGTGPFELAEWSVNDHLTVRRNPSYWQTDAAGRSLPYLDEVVFRPIPEAGSRLNALKAGEIDMMHTDDGEQLDELRAAADDDRLAVVSSDDFAEVTYGLLNASAPPFDDLDARLAMASAIDRDAYAQVVDAGATTVASGPFGPGEPGYLEDSGFPAHDLDTAKEHVAAYERRTGGPLEFSIATTSDPASLRAAQFLQEQAQAAGARVTIEQLEQATLVNTLLTGDFQWAVARNHPGGNPDGQYVWWQSRSPVNFGRISDPEIDRLLDDARSAADPAVATADYEAVNRRFADQAWNIWLTWTNWAIASGTDIHGVVGPDLPNGSKPFTGLATGHPLSGLYRSS